jgi:hypothetical protein
MLFGHLRLIFKGKIRYFFDVIPSGRWAPAAAAAVARRVLSDKQ